MARDFGFDALHAAIFVFNARAFGARGAGAPDEFDGGAIGGDRANAHTGVRMRRLRLRRARASVHRRAMWTPVLLLLLTRAYVGLSDVSVREVLAASGGDAAPRDDICRVVGGAPIKIGIRLCEAPRVTRGNRVREYLDRLIVM